jgi:hypothetical protein
MALATAIPVASLSLPSVNGHRSAFLQLLPQLALESLEDFITR